VAQSWQRALSPGWGAIRPPHSGQATGASADTAAQAPLISWSSVERPPTATGRQAGARRRSRPGLSVTVR